MPMTATTIGLRSRSGFSRGRPFFIRGRARGRGAPGPLGVEPPPGGPVGVGPPGGGVGGVGGVIRGTSRP
ncbi:hypothetical protein GCM10009735_03900 [Actinomadura chokoriensis]